MEFPKVATCKFNENFLVYSDGSLYCSRRETFKAVSTNGTKSPYLHYVIPSPDRAGKSKKHYIHRLVAEHFLPNPDNLRDVHHKDSNPKNNDLSNLEWLSHKDNCRKKIIDPIEKVEKNKDAYLYQDMKNCPQPGDTTPPKKYVAFRFTGLLNSNIPPCQKYFSDLQSAREFRDFHFLSNQHTPIVPKTQSEVA